MVLPVHANAQFLEILACNFYTIVSTSAFAAVGKCRSYLMFATYYRQRQQCSAYANDCAMVVRTQSGLRQAAVAMQKHTCTALLS
eukprot:21471-Heterococcus_DN1.PRE.7